MGRLRALEVGPSQRSEGCASACNLAVDRRSEYARLGVANGGTGYVLRRPPAGRPGILSRLPGQGRAPGYVLTVPERDVTGHRTLSDLRDKGVNPVADALAQSAQHIRGFLVMLRRGGSVQPRQRQAAQPGDATGLRSEGRPGSSRRAEQQHWHGTCLCRLGCDAPEMLAAAEQPVPVPAQYQQLESVRECVLIKHLGDRVPVGENDLCFHAQVTGWLLLRPLEFGEVRLG